MANLSTQFNVSNWSQDGVYKIKANQGTSLLYSITVGVEVNSGMTVETSTTESSFVSNQSNDDLAPMSTRNNCQVWTDYPFQQMQWKDQILLK